MLLLAILVQVKVLITALIVLWSVWLIILISTSVDYYDDLNLQGSIFWRSGVDTEESFWDTAEDAKFEVKEPEAKRSKTEEWTARPPLPTNI